MSEEEVKVQRHSKVPISEKDHRFLSTLNDRTRKSYTARLLDLHRRLVDKLRRGSAI